MKILHIAGGGDRGGAKTHILALCSRLAQSNELKLLSLRKGEFTEDARALGIDTEEISSRLLGRDLREMKALVREFKPDIVHCHGAKANLAGVFMKYFCGCTVITTVHSDYQLDYMHSFLKRNTYGRLNSIALRLVNYRVSVSDTFKNMLISRGFTPSKIMTIYNGLDFDTQTPDFDRAAFLRELGVDFKAGDIVLGIAARLTPVKDIPTLITAFAEASKQCENLKLIIGGDGEDLQKLQHMAHKLGVDGKICFCGWVSEIGKFFKACDIDVLSSISESFPYSILEGVKEGCAVITSDVGGMSTLITSAEDGFIFQSGDTATFAKHIVTLARDADMRRTFAQKLRQRAAKTYSLDGMAARQNEIYRNIAALKLRGKRNGITICGAYGRGNSGDEAILDAIILAMRGIDPLATITVMTRKPKETRLSSNVNAVYTFNLPSFLKIMRHSTLFINGGGSLIQDVTSKRSLYFYLFSIYAAKKLGCKVLMYGCGIGHVKTPFNRKLAQRVLNRDVDIITLRDATSADELLEMGVTRPDIRMAADPAVSLPMLSEEHANAFLVKNSIPTDGEYICFALRQWHGFYDFGAFADAAQYAYEKYNLTAVFLPIEYPRDVAAAVETAALMKPPFYIIENPSHDVRVDVAVLRKMRLVCGMRLHSIVFSAMAKTSFFAVCYDIKVSGFMKYIGVPNFCMLDELHTNWLCAQIDELMQPPNNEAHEAIVTKLIDLEHENARAAKFLLGIE